MASLELGGGDRRSVELFPTMQFPQYKSLTLTALFIYKKVMNPVPFSPLELAAFLERERIILQKRLKSFPDLQRSLHWLQLRNTETWGDPVWLGLQMIAWGWRGLR